MVTNRQAWDRIVVGGGVTGAAVAYELSRQGLRVLLIERDEVLEGATRYGYGGLPYWTGYNELTRYLCQVGHDRHRQLSAELDWDTEFRDLQMLMVIDPQQDPEAIRATYQHLAIVPEHWDHQRTQAFEPLLNPEAHQGSLVVPHGHVRPTAMAAGFVAALQRQGGQVVHETVVGLERTGERITGVQTPTQTYTANQVVICAGGWSRSLLRKAGIAVPLYFTHAESLEMEPWDYPLKAFIHTAHITRFALEANACTPDKADLWDQPGHETVPAIFDAGIFQMRDHSLRLGQMSRALTDPHAPLNPQVSAEQMRQAVVHLMPALASRPSQWYHCLVAFCADALPLIGPIPGWEGIAMFSGFSNPLLFVPTLARWFAEAAVGDPHPLLKEVRLERFMPSYNS